MADLPSLQSDSQFETDEDRVGFSFGKPDTISDYHAPGWGYLYTADELRYIMLFGNRLTATEVNQTYTNNMLLAYTQAAIYQFEKEFGCHVLPRLNLYQERRDSTTGQRKAREVPEEYKPWADKLLPHNRKKLLQEGIGTNYSWQDIPSENYLYIRLDFRPLVKIIDARLVDPQFNNMVNLLPITRERKGFDSSIEFFPDQSFILTYPFMPWGSRNLIRYPYNNFPDTFLIDYVSGYENAADVPDDIREIIRKIAGIMLMAEYGDGKSAAVASASASLNAVSESYSTTQSATSATFGARILQYQKEIAQYKKATWAQYSQAAMGTL